MGDSFGGNGRDPSHRLQQPFRRIKSNLFQSIDHKQAQVI
jgi:hypothetical protein